MSRLDIVGFVTTQIHFHMTASKTRHQQTVTITILQFTIFFYIAHAHNTMDISQSASQTV